MTKRKVPGKKKARDAKSVISRQLDRLVKSRTDRIKYIKKEISDSKRTISAIQRRIKANEKRAKEMNEERENIKKTILKEADKVKIKVGQAIYHKKHGNCLVKRFTTSSTHKSIMVVLTGVNGGTYKVPHNQCIPFEDMTSAIFG